MLVHVLVGVRVWRKKEDSVGTAAGDGAGMQPCRDYSSSLQTRRGCEDKMSSSNRDLQSKVLARGDRAAPGVARSWESPVLELLPGCDKLSRTDDDLG